jgi:hypothetical protein
MKKFLSCVFSLALLATSLTAQTWQHSFSAPTKGIYQVVLPFKSGEWEKDPIGASFFLPYATHPDASTSRVALIFELPKGTYNLNPNEIKKLIVDGIIPDTVTPLPPPPELVVNQGSPQWAFSTNHPGNKWKWVTLNRGLVAHRLWAGRMTNGPWGEGATNRCDFGLRIWLLYWRGQLVRTEILLIGCQPNQALERNWPLTGGVFLDGTEIMTRFARGSIGDFMCAWHRDDKLTYQVCDNWAGHHTGSHQVDYTKVRGGDFARLLGEAERRKTRPWWEAFWGHALGGGSSGMHGDFGVCRLDVAAGMQAKDTRLGPALHELCNEWLSAPYHIIDSEGFILRQEMLGGGQYGGQSWSLGMGELDFRCAWPQYGKTQNAEKPIYNGRTSEAASHMRSNGLACLLEFAPTPMFLEEVAGHRVQNMLKIYNGEERAYARHLATGIESLPFVRGPERQRLIKFLSDRMRSKISAYKAAGYRAYRADGPWDQWIPGKKIFLPWQDQMLLGAIWNAHLSGWLPLTMDEQLTVKKTVQWFVDVCWRKVGDAWESPYVTASDLSEHVWSGDPGIFGQGIAALEVLKDYPKAKTILEWWATSPSPWHPADRWVPKR